MPTLPSRLRSESSLLREVVSWGMARFVAPYAAYLVTQERRRKEESRLEERKIEDIRGE